MPHNSPTTMCFQGSYGQESYSCNEIINTWIEEYTDDRSGSLRKLQTAGFDDVYPSELIRNCGERTKQWLISFMNDVLSSARLPKFFKRTKVIAIPKSRKDRCDPAL
jgi:hypothetical protein